MKTATVATYRIIEVPITARLLQYSPRLVRTGADFYDTLKAAAEMSVATGRYVRPPTAAEEHQIYVQKSGSKKRLQDVEELKDYFGNNADSWFAWGAHFGGPARAGRVC